jgi:hypothetical protein
LLQGRGVKYKLVDQDGEDITVTELVDRYLNSPEICFKEPAKESNNVSQPPPPCSNIKTTIQNNPTEESSSPPESPQQQQPQQQEPVIKPLEQWTYTDFRSNGCIYCINDGGYLGPLPLTTDEYERHIVAKHKDRPTYPGPADVEKYGLKLNGHDEKEKTTVVVNTRDKNYDVFTGRKCQGHWDEDDIYGNPYIVGLDGTQEEVVKKYRVWFHGDTPYKGKDPAEVRRRARNELVGKRLGCPGNCKPGPCHGDVLADYANKIKNGQSNSEKSKLAEMVEANESGNVLFGNKEETEK